MKKRAYPTCRVDLGGRRVDVEYRLHPARRAPHVGADSPRFLSPDRPARVELIRVLLDRVDVTRRLEAETKTAVEIAVCKEAGVAGLGPAGFLTSFPQSAFSFRAEKERRIGARILAAREREHADEQDQLHLEGA